MKASTIIFIFLFSFSYTQESSECLIAQELYDASNTAEAYFEINNLEDLNDECKFLAFKILFKMESYDEAKIYLDQLIQLNPDNSEYIKQSNLVIRILQEYKAAKYTLDKIDISEAIDEFKKLLSDPELSKVSLFYNGLGLAYKKKDQELQASSLLDFTYLDLSINNYSIANSINSNKGYNEEILNISKFLTNKGKASMKADELENALNYFNKAIKYSPNYSLANFYLGNLYMKIQDYQLAAQSYQSGLGKAAKDGNPKILYLLGQCYVRLETFDLAKQYFEYAINNKNDYTKAEFALANVYFKQQDYSKAEQYIKQLLAHDSNYIKAYELLVNIYIEKNDFITAKSYALEGVNVNSKSYILFSQLAFLENENKLYNNSIEHADKALSIKRNYGPALIELAKSNVNLCNSVAAAEAFKGAKRYDRSQVAKLEKWAAEHYKTVCKK